MQWNGYISNRMMTYLNLLLLEVTKYLTESQSERQWLHCEGSILLISFLNCIVFHGSQLGRVDPLDLGRYQGTHWVRGLALVMLM